MKKVYRHSKIDLIIKLSIYGCLSFLIIGIPLFMRKLIKYYKESIILTEKSVILKQGFLNVRTNEIPYSKITNVQLSTSLFSESIRIYTGQGEIIFDNLDKGSGISSEINNKLN